MKGQEVATLGETFSEGRRLSLYAASSEAPYSTRAEDAEQRVKSQRASAPKAKAAVRGRYLQKQNERNRLQHQGMPVFLGREQGMQRPYLVLCVVGGYMPD